MKKWVSLGITAVAALSLAACGNNKSTAKDSSSAKAKSESVAESKAKAKSISESKAESSSKLESSAKEEAASASSESRAKAASKTAQSSTTTASSSQQDTNSSSVAPISEDQARTILGGANGDMNATRINGGWQFNDPEYPSFFCYVTDSGQVSYTGNPDEDTSANNQSQQATDPNGLPINSDSDGDGFDDQREADNAQKLKDYVATHHQSDFE
jgi:hypothetical protein